MASNLDLALNIILNYQDKTKSLSSQEEIVKKLILSLNEISDTNIKIKEYALYFILDAYFQRQQRLFSELDELSPFSQDLVSIHSQMEDDITFQGDYDLYFSDYKNLNHWFLYILKQASTYYGEQKQAHQNESDRLSDEINAQLQHFPNIKGKKSLILSVHLFIREAKKHNERTHSLFFEWIHPYFQFYKNSLAAMPANIQHAYVRTKETQAAIQAGFNAALTGIYRYTGQYAYAFPLRLNGLRISTDKVLSKLKERKEISENKDRVDKKQFKVLDIGTGNECFILSNRYSDDDVVIDVYGLTATDFRNKEDMKKYNSETIDYLESHYIVGKNAEFLHAIDELKGKDKQFDFIFSRMTFMHLADSAGAVIQAYEKLKMGGVLMIDVFYLPGCEGFLHTIIKRLKQVGYRVVAEGDKEMIKSFIIQKTPEQPHLDFAIQYEKSIKDGKVQYTPNFIEPDNILDKDQYVNGIKMINAEIKQRQLSSILDQYHDIHQLLDLTNSSEFKKCKPRDQYLLILGLVGRKFKTYEMEDMIQSVNKLLDNNYKYLTSLFNSALLSDQSSMIFDMVPTSEFMKSKDESKSALLMVASIFDLIRMGRKNDDEKTLKQMGIAFTEEPHYEFYNDVSLVIQRERRVTSLNQGKP